MEQQELATGRPHDVTDAGPGPAWSKEIGGLFGAARWQGGLVLALTVLFLIVWQSPPQSGFEGVANYTWLHLALETLSILVAGMVFGVAWNAYSGERPANIILLACGLLATGIIDFAHALSFKGMPNFLTPSDPEKAINFWLAARYTFAVTLAAVSLHGWRPLKLPAMRYLALAASLAGALAVVLAGLLFQSELPRTYIAGQGLTPLKVGAEFLIIAILVVPAAIFLRQARKPHAYDPSSLFAAAAVSILSELCFTLYSDVTDIFNLLGHVYKVVAFAMIYRAIFVVSVREPFARAVQAEDSMRAASFYVRSLIEASIDPMFMISPAGTLTDVNRAAESAAGLPREALVGTEFSAYFTDPAGARAAWQTVLAEGVARNYPLTIRGRSGACLDVMLNAVAYRNQAGRMQGVLAAARDMTEIRRAQDALVQQHALLAKITETSPIGIVVWGIEGRVEFANGEAERLAARSGCALTRVAAQGGTQGVAKFADFSGHPLTDADLPFAKVKAACAPFHNLELALTCSADDTTLLLVNASPLFGADGELQGVVATLDDVTQRRAAEERLRRSEAWLKVAMAAARMGSWTWDVMRDKVEYSEDFSMLMGLPRDVSHARLDEVLAAIHQDDRERVAGVLRQAQLEEKGEWVDFRVKWPDGTLHWISAHGTVERNAAGTALKISGLGMDISERKRSELALQRMYRALRSLSATNERLIHSRSETELLESVCRVIVETGGYRMAWVGRPQQDAQQTVRRVAQYGDDGGFLAGLDIVWSDTERGQGPTGRAIRTGATHLNQSYATNADMAPWREQALKRGLQSSIAFPLRVEDGIYGALTIYAGEPDAFDADEVKLLQELADDLAFGIATLRVGAERDRMQHEQQHYEARLRDSLVESIQALGSTVEMRDPYTAGHQRRAAELARDIGREMGLPDLQLQGLHLAAAIHDIGKIHIPAELLCKPGKLSAIEMELIRTHAQVGYDILKDIRFPWPIARIVLEHHERVDGSGYPNRRTGEQLLIESMILTVADVVEAMTSHRPYRPALGIEVALEHILKYRGVWYDARAVDACVKLFREHGYTFEASGAALHAG